MVEYEASKVFYANLPFSNESTARYRHLNHVHCIYSIYQQNGSHVILSINKDEAMIFNVYFT